MPLTVAVTCVQINKSLLGPNLPNGYMAATLQSDRIFRCANRSPTPSVPCVVGDFYNPQEHLQRRQVYMLGNLAEFNMAAENPSID